MAHVGTSRLKFWHPWDDLGVWEDSPEDEKEPRPPGGSKN